MRNTEEQQIWWTQQNIQRARRQEAHTRQRCKSHRVCRRGCAESRSHQMPKRSSKEQQLVDEHSTLMTVVNSDLRYNEWRQSPLIISSFDVYSMSKCSHLNSSSNLHGDANFFLPLLLYVMFTQKQFLRTVYLLTEMLISMMLLFYMLSGSVYACDIDK